MAASQENGRIPALQSLRALAFLGIFLSHCGIIYSWASLGVSIFFILSGFLLSRSYVSKEEPVSVKNSLRFSLSRIKKIYPLHILTMILAIILSVIVYTHEGWTLRTAASLFGQILLNIFLLQSWYPDSMVNVSLNGVAWYLSAMVFLYFMFPYIRRRIKNAGRSILLLSCVLVLAAEVLICMPLIRLWGELSHIYIWFQYCFPLFRLGDFYIGCCLGKIFSESRPSSPSVLKYTILEILALLLPVLQFRWMLIPPTSLFSRALHSNTIVYILIAAILVWLFAVNGGLITRILSNPVLIYIGNISSYAFLIHFTVIQYMNAYLSLTGTVLSPKRSAVLYCAEFAASIALSALYRKIELRIRQR